MLAKVNSCAVIGLEGSTVEVEVDISPGLPSFTIVGLPDTAVQEARERVRAAIRNTGYDFPLKRITVNLAPADLKKAGPAYDLPIAVGVLLSSDQAPQPPSGSLFLGELSLDGHLRHTNGVLPMVALARDAGFETVFVPGADAKEAALVEGVQTVAVDSLAALVALLRGESLPPLPSPGPDGSEPPKPELSYSGPDLRDIRGQEYAKRAVEVAAAGGHNILLTGPPGSGKTLLARSMPSLLPPLIPQESLDVTKIYSVRGLLPQETPLISERPFRAPHYTISNVGLVGSGRWPLPGEITLSHRGVLFLDELPEFGHMVLEVLPPAPGGPSRDHQPGAGERHLPRQLHAGGRYEPMLVRLPRRPQEAVHLLPQHGGPVPEAGQRPPAGQVRHIRRGTARGVREAGGGLDGGDL